ERGFGAEPAGRRVMEAAAPIAMHRALAPEDAARGDFYALLARLLRAGPDAKLLAQLANAPALAEEADPAFASAWRLLVEASSVMDSDAAAEEYDALFAGVGKAPVSIYAGFHAGAPAIHHPRVRIQSD